MFKTEKHVFNSTGNIRFDDDLKVHVESGSLEWKDKKAKHEFITWVNTQPEVDEILQKVKNTLSGIAVCCGGCI